MCIILLLRTNSAIQTHSLAKFGCTRVRRLQYTCYDSFVSVMSRSSKVTHTPPRLCDIQSHDSYCLRQWKLAPTTSSACSDEACESRSLRRRRLDQCFVPQVVTRIGETRPVGRSVRYLATRSTGHPQAPLDEQCKQDGDRGGGPSTIWGSLLYYFVVGRIKNVSGIEDWQLWIFFLLGFFGISGHVGTSKGKSGDVTKCIVPQNFKDITIFFSFMEV